MDYDTAIQALIDELSPFFEVAGKDGWSLFDCSRVREAEDKLDERLDDNSFMEEAFDKLQDKYNCVVHYYSTDMGSYVIQHNDYEFDEFGNVYKLVST